MYCTFKKMAELKPKTIVSKIALPTYLKKSKLYVLQV